MQPLLHLGLVHTWQYQQVPGWFSATHGVLSCSGLDDAITSILASLRPADVRPVLAAMSQHVPRTLDALLLHALPPAAAEMLTQKLEQADAAAVETEGNPLWIFG